MSNQPNITDLECGVKELAKAVDDVMNLASILDDGETVREKPNENDILRFCAVLQKHNAPVSKLLTIQSQCTEAAMKLYDYTDHVQQARYCIETSLQAAESGSIAMEFASNMEEQIRMLHDRANKRNSNRWTASNEGQFWQRHRRLDQIAGIYNVSPQIPDQGKSIPPTREETDIDRTLKKYLTELEKIPKYHRTILDGLDKMSQEMAHKYYKD